MNLAPPITDEHRELLERIETTRQMVASVSQEMYRLYPSLPLLSRFRFMLDLFPEQLELMQEATWQDSSLTADEETALQALYEAHKAQARQVVPLTAVNATPLESPVEWWNNLPRFHQAQDDDNVIPGVEQSVRMVDGLIRSR